MIEAEQADEAWQVAKAMPDVAAMIAKNAREKLDVVDVVVTARWIGSSGMLSSSTI